MDLKELSLQDWKDFEKEYPQAMSFLLGKSTKNEFDNLVLLSNIFPERMTEWQRDRLMELQNILAQP